jgi:hypothetical protein
MTRADPPSSTANASRQHQHDNRSTNKIADSLSWFIFVFFNYGGLIRLRRIKQLVPFCDTKRVNGERRPLPAPSSQIVFGCLFSSVDRLDIVFYDVVLSQQVAVS